MTDHLHTALAGIRSLAAYISVSLYVLLLAPPGIVLAVIFKWPEILYWLARGGVRLGLATVGITFHVTGLEHVQRHRAAVYCVNHASNIEPPILFMVLKALHPKLVVLYKAELRKALPVLKRAWDVVGFVPIERGSRARSMQAIETAAAALRGGKSFLIFPEGTRTTPGIEPSLQRGAAQIATRTQTDLRVIHITVSPTFLTKEKKWYQVPVKKPFFHVAVKGKIEVAPFIESSNNLTSAARRLNHHLAQTIFPSEENI